MEGMAVSSMRFLEEYLDAQIRSICNGLPSCVRYVSFERCTPEEEFQEITKARNNRRAFDLAKSSVYLVKYFFEFTDQMGHVHPIVRYIFLPFVNTAGIMYIGGTQYHIVPVLSDKVFTPGRDSIFVRLTQDRNNMYRVYHTLIIDGKRESKYVVWAVIYRGENKDTRISSTTNAKTTLTHYLFGKYGFTETFKRYAGAVPVVGGKEINKENYPSEDWILIESTGVKPVSCMDKVYQKTPIRLAVRRCDWNASMETLVTGFYYIIDHFPTRFRPIVKHLDMASEWKIMIGFIRFSAQYGEDKLHREISEHYETVDGYLDIIAKNKLADEGVFLENYYDLLHHIQVNFNAMLQNTEGTNLSVYGKTLEVLSYILYGILYGFVMVKFRLSKIMSRKGMLTLKDVTENFHRRLKMGIIFKLSSGKIVTEAVSYGGDSLYPKITAVIAEQENRAGANRGKSDRVVVGPQHRIDLSMVTVGSVLNLPKSNPTPLARINPWVTVDQRTGTVLPNPKFEKLLEENYPLFKLS